MSALDSDRPADMAGTRHSMGSPRERPLPRRTARVRGTGGAPPSRFRRRPLRRARVEVRRARVARRRAGDGAPARDPPAQQRAAHHAEGETRSLARCGDGGVAQNGSMAGRFVLTTAPEELVEMLDVDRTAADLPGASYNIAPSDRVTVVIDAVNKDASTDDY